MSDAAPSAAWQFFRFGLLVTGEGEEAFLPALFASLARGGHCHFRVLRRIGQRSAIVSPKHKLKMVGTGKTIADKDEQEIGLPARRWLDGGAGRLVLLIDDLEHDRRESARAIFQRYRGALDALLGERRGSASVHFLVNMIEAYYFAHAAAVNAVLGTSLRDHEGDVETIRHPKNDLKKLGPFDEKKDGARIVASLDLEHVLARPDTCASLRVLIAWCCAAMSAGPTERFCLDGGVHDIVTGPQLAALPPGGSVL